MFVLETMKGISQNQARITSELILEVNVAFHMKLGSQYLATTNWTLPGIALTMATFTFSL